MSKKSVNFARLNRTRERDGAAKPVRNAHNISETNKTE